MDRFKFLQRREENDYETIMRTIKAGLTGKSEQDIPYLMKKAKDYTEHKQGGEIVRECGRMIYGLLSEEQRAEYLEAMKKDGPLHR